MNSSKDSLTKDKAATSELKLPATALSVCQSIQKKPPVPVTISSVEDRILKDSMQYFGRELFPRLGIEGTVTGVAPTESVDIQMKDLLNDYTFEMGDSGWRHLEFESDRVSRADLIRFRASEALTSHIYHVNVITTVLCTANVKKPVTELHTGISTYRIHLVSMKKSDGDEKIRRMEQLQGSGIIQRGDLAELLLTPLMSGKMTIKERIQRSMQILKKEREHLGEEDYRRMSSIMFAFATKFLTKDDMNDLKEVFHMSILGQMIYDDGKKAGLEEGKTAGLAEGLAQGKAVGLAEGKAAGLAEGKAVGLAEGKAVGLAEGKAEAAESTQLGAIQALMHNLKMTAEQAMSVLNVPKIEWGKYSSLL